MAIVCAVLGGIISKNNIKSDVENSESNHRSVPADDVSFANQSQEIIITDKASIEKICKEYGIGNTEEIEKMIYIPLKEQSKDLKMTESNNLYFIKQLGFSENIEHLIFSSWYMAPGGFRESSEIF